MRQIHYMLSNYLRKWLTLSASLLILTACKGTPIQHTSLIIGGNTMGTYYKITIIDLPTNINPTTLQKKIENLLEDTNNLLSTYREHSELSRFNQTKHTNWVNISADLAAVIIKAKQLSELSAGAFDITIGPLVNLWGFGSIPSTDHIPDAQQIQEQKKIVGYQMLEIDPINLKLRKIHPNIYLDLSALGEGYGIDQISHYLESQQILNYLVEIGGDMKTRGHNETGNPWRIAVEKPSNTENTRIQDTIEIQQGGIGTSGNYRNFFEANNTHYSHIIDPHTGYPVTHTAVSVTVIQPSAIDADGLSTTLLVMGPTTGFKLATQRDIPALFIIREGNSLRSLSTPAFDRYEAQ